MSPIEWFEQAIVDGRMRYVGDGAPPGALHARIVRSPYAHARVLAHHAHHAHAGLAAVGVHALAHLRLGAGERCGKHDGKSGNECQNARAHGCLQCSIEAN